MPKTFWKLVAVIFLGGVLQSAGKFSNRKVVSANHEQMPVWCLNPEVCSDMMEDPDHVTISRQTRYHVLSDILPVWEPMHGGIEVEGMASIGDAGIFIGWMLFELSVVVLLGYLIFTPIQRLWKYFSTE